MAGWLSSPCITQRTRTAVPIDLWRGPNIRGCIQKFPDWLLGARTANGIALCHWVQLHRYFVNQSSEFFRHNPFCCFSTNVYCCKHIFRYRLSPETFGYTLVFEYRSSPDGGVYSFALQHFTFKERGIWGGGCWEETMKHNTVGFSRFLHITVIVMLYWADGEVHVRNPFPLYLTPM
jgi:hypothetical protein